MKNQIPIRLIVAFAICVMMLSLLSLTVSADCAHNYVRVYQMENASMHSYKSQCIYCGTVTEGWGYSGWLDHNFNSYGTCVDCGYYQAPTCAHYYANTVYQYENDSMHSYYGVCTSCGQRLEGMGYSGWSNHSFKGNTCTQCGFVKSCLHLNSTMRYNNLGTYHSRYMYCNDCGISYSTVTEQHALNYGPCTSISDSSHSRTLTCLCGAMDSQSEMHYFSGNTCTSCGFQKPVVNATVSLSAYSSSGTLGSSGGEISSEVIPASYTVTATASGCTVTQIIYVQNGRTYTTPGNSVTITANSESDFTTTSFTAQTDAGVTAAFTVNHKFVKKNSAQIMWETSHTATIRSIVGNGLNKTLTHTMEIPNSYDSQTNLTSAQSAEIQSLIGRDDGQTYVVNYTRVITVYTPAEYSSTGQKVIRGTYDGNSLAEIEECISAYGWTAQTQTAIRQAASSSLSFTTSKQIECTAVWIDTTSYEQIYTKSFGTSVSTYNTSSVSVSYSEFPNSANYVYESLTYSGDTVGNSDSTTYSQTCTATSRPLTVTFYCHPKTVTPPETTHGSVTVVVRDYDTGDPIMGASVSGAGLSKTTGSSGRALFGYIELGGYTFTASKSGYNDGSTYATINAAEPNVTVEIYLQKPIAAPETPPIDTGGGTNVGGGSCLLTITVYDAQYLMTLSGASVFGHGYSSTTTVFGTVLVGNILPGTYTFTASYPGFTPNTGTVTIGPYDTSASLAIFLSPQPTSGSINVTVRDKTTNALISGASVSDGGYSGTTSTSGVTSFTSIPFGTYNFTSSKSGYNSGSASAVISAYSPSASVTIYLEKPTVTKGSIIVEVRDIDTNALISGASVTGGGRSGTTSSDGKVTFADMSLGSYTFSASKSGYTSGSSTATITATQPAATVTIYLDKQPTDGIIVVNVRDKSTNALLSGALIEGGGRSGTTGDAGSIAFINIPFGTYTFTASKTGYNSGTATAAISVSQTTTTVTIYLEKLPTSGSITVTVRDKSTNALISGATVTSGGLSGTTPSTGKVTFTNVPFGSYTFTASKYGYTPSSATAVISVSSTTASVTIYLEENLADVGITANTVNGTVYRGSKIMVAATVRGDAETDFTPTNPLTVTMQMSFADGTLIDTHVKSLICPKSETNLVWFAVTVPENGFTSPNMKFTLTVTMPDGLTESNTSDNTSTRTATTYILPNRQSPDADFELNAPSSFTNSPYRTTTATTRTWSVWEWSSGFVKRNYSARLTTSAKLTPDVTAVVRLVARRNYDDFVLVERGLKRVAPKLATVGYSNE